MRGKRFVTLWTASLTLLTPWEPRIRNDCLMFSFVSKPQGALELREEEGE